MSKMKLVGIVALGSCFSFACGDDAESSSPELDGGATTEHHHTDAGGPSASAPQHDAGSPSEGFPGTDAGDASPNGPTFYGEILPLFEKNCLGCHAEDGIGPMRLDEYAAAKQYASAIQAATDSRSMPPFLVQNDGECGDFANAPYLTEDELQTIRDWVSHGTPEGDPREAELPESASLPDTHEVATPLFAPVEGGGHLDAHDDYRCFLIDPPEAGKFITGYEVLPGNAAIVHHVVVNLVNLDGPSEYPATDAGVLTNGQVIEQLDAQDPDVLGWRCYGLAGDGVAVDSVPTVWAPGQGTVRYPDAAGIPILPTQKLVVQVHYNLEDEAHHGETDQTRVRFELAEPEDVPNVGVYLPMDPLLNSILSGGDPVTLPPGEASTKYTWTHSFAEMGLAGVPEFKLWGLFPHMHETGHKYTVELLPSGDEAEAQCAARVDRWDFHWQHLYFYEQGTDVTPEDAVRVTCDYDTRGKTEPILPGWGTQNEMCFLGLFVTVPNAR